MDRARKAWANHTNMKIKRAADSGEFAALIFISSVLPRHHSLFRENAGGEERFRPDSRSMGSVDTAFAWSSLPTGGQSEAKAEPKCNVSCIFKHDFSAQFVQVDSLPISKDYVARSMPDHDFEGSSALRLVSRLDMVVKPLGEIVDRCDMVRFALPNPYHRNDKKY